MSSGWKRTYRIKDPYELPDESTKAGRLLFMVGVSIISFTLFGYIVWASIVGGR